MAEILEVVKADPENVIAPDDSGYVKIFLNTEADDRLCYKNSENEIIFLEPEEEPT